MQLDYQEFFEKYFFNRSEKRDREKRKAATQDVNVNEVFGKMLKSFNSKGVVKSRAINFYGS